MGLVEAQYSSPGMSIGTYTIIRVLSALANRSLIAHLQSPTIPLFTAFLRVFPALPRNAGSSLDLYYTFFPGTISEKSSRSVYLKSCFSVEEKWRFLFTFQTSQCEPNQFCRWLWGSTLCPHKRLNAQLQLSMDFYPRMRQSILQPPSPPMALSITQVQRFQQMIRDFQHFAQSQSTLSRPQIRLSTLVFSCPKNGTAGSWLQGMEDLGEASIGMIWRRMP